MKRQKESKRHTRTKNKRSEWTSYCRRIRREIVVCSNNNKIQHLGVNTASRTRYEHRCHYKSEHETFKVIYYVIMIVIASESKSTTNRNGMAWHGTACNTILQYETSIHSYTHSFTNIPKHTNTLRQSKCDVSIERCRPMQYNTHAHTHFTNMAHTNTMYICSI